MGTKPIPANSLQELSITHKLPEPSRKKQQIIIQAPNTSLIFYENSRRLLFNNVLIMMNAPLSIQNEKCFLSPTDINDTIEPLLSSHKLVEKYPIKTVILDPGHGGSDPGTCGKNSTKEKTIVFDIARKCQKKLENMGIKAVMTRTRDKYIPLKARPQLATKLKADIFVSIHANSSVNLAANGIETHILPATGFPCTASSHLSKKAYSGSKDNKMSVLLAYSIHKSILKTTNAEDRGIKRSRFSVLRNAPCPAILIECGFLSNLTEEKKLNNPAYRDKIAAGIANGIKLIMNNEE